MSSVQDLRGEIRDFIQHPRWLGPLLSDVPNWNVLGSAFDTVADTEYAIETYEAIPASDDVGILYLLIYGILQAVYVQQDAVEAMVRAFEPNVQRRYRIEDEPEADEIRKLRNRAIGHPTKEGDVKSKTRQQSSFRIVQRSMCKSGFTLLTSFSDGQHMFTDVSIQNIIEKNRRMVERILQRIKDKLEAAEMEHRKQFSGEKLVHIFPEMLGYYFEKIFAGIDGPASGDGQFGKIHLDLVATIVQKFREALERRCLLNRASEYDCYLKEVEYPIAELQQYYAGRSFLQDSRAAHIFAHFVRDKVGKLERMAVELDEEYEEQLHAGPPGTGST